MLEIKTNPTYVIILISVVSAFFLATGLGSIGVGIYYMVQPDDEDRSLTLPMGPRKLATGCLDLLVGIFGSLGAMKQSRVCLSLHLALLLAQILMSVSFLIACPFITAYKSDAYENEARKKLIKMYGDPKEGDYTTRINMRQFETPCCYYFGESSENIFKKTPWFIKQNTQQPSSPTHKTKSVPDSCCVKADENCNTVEDIQAARKAKFLHNEDCVQKKLGKLHDSLVYNVIMLTCGMLLQTVISSAIFFGMYKNSMIIFQGEDSMSFSSAGE